MADRKSAALRFAWIVGRCGVAGSGDEIAAGMAGPGRLRASHADREQVIEVLKAAFVQGRLAKDEFEARIGEALTSRTYAELAALTTDVPAGPRAVQPSKPAWAQDLKPVPRPAPVIMAASALYAGLWALVLFVRSDPLAGALTYALAMLTVFILTGMIGFGIAKLASRHQERSRGQLPRRPASGAGDRASGRLPSADTAGQPPVKPVFDRNTAALGKGAQPGGESTRRGRLQGFLVSGRLTATAATNGKRQRSAVHAHTCTLHGELGIRPA